MTASTSSQTPPAATTENTDIQAMVEAPVQTACHPPARVSHNPIEAEMIARFEPATSASTATPTQVEDGNASTSASTATPTQVEGGNASTSRTAEIHHQLIAHSIRQWAETEFGSRSRGENENPRQAFINENGTKMSAAKVCYFDEV
jgi:hypothetical protein